VGLRCGAAAGPAGGSGQAITFYEQGAGVLKRLGVAKGNAGRLRFKPSAGRREAAEGRAPVRRAAADVDTGAQRRQAGGPRATGQWHRTGLPRLAQGAHAEGPGRGKTVTGKATVVGLGADGAPGRTARVTVKRG
jgi:hypothetical protein